MSYAMYLRKSRAEEGESTQQVLAKHRTALLELAAKLRISVKDCYEEVVSGESLHARPEMLRLLEQVQAGAYEAVLCMDIDRLGRGGMADQGTILDAFRLSETLIICPDKTYDLNDETDEQLTEFKAFFARQEYKAIRKRMRRGLLQVVHAGGYVANAPYGYRRCTVGKLPSLEIVEDEARFIRHIYTRYASGVGAHIIAQELNAMGSMTTRGNPWSRSSVRNILRNPTYMGKVAFNRVRHYRPGAHGNPNHHVVYAPESDWILVEGLHPAIIPPEDWHKVQQLRTARQVPPTSHYPTNPMSGILFCARCGQRIQRMEMHKEAAYMLCTNKGCCAGSKFAYVEQALLDGMQERLDDLRTQISRSTPPDTAGPEAALAALEKELAKLDARMDRLYTFLEDGTYDRDTFRQRMQAAQADRSALLERQAGLQQKLAEIRSRDLQKIADRLEEAIRLYPTLKPNEQNILLKSVIERVNYTKYKKSKPRDFNLDIILRGV